MDLQAFVELTYFFPAFFWLRHADFVYIYLYTYVWNHTFSLAMQHFKLASIFIFKNVLNALTLPGDPTWVTSV